LESLQNTANHASKTADNSYEGDLEPDLMTEMREQIDSLLDQIEQSLHAGTQIDGRRASFRCVWPGHATVQLVDSNGSSEPLLVTVGHISRDSLDFRSPQRFKIDQKLLITLETNQGQLQIPTTVMHTTESVIKFIIGVKFDLPNNCKADDNSDCQADDSKCQTADEQ
jgi:hypothetical protein